jgi:UDP-2,3-diacylglucosamine pyrophosphatase LpxH
MPDAVILSDLHLGAANSRHREAFRLLRRAARRTDRLILNGDIVDHWDLIRWPREHLRTLDGLRRLARRVEVVWVWGNHEGTPDEATAVLGLPFVEQYHFASAGVPAVCLHGHQFDSFLDDHPFLTRLGDLTYQAAQALDPTHRLARWGKHRSKVLLATAKAVAAGALRVARRAGCGLVAAGHTHLPALREADDGVCYANTGCWTEKPSSYLVIEAGRVELRQLP